MCNYLQRNGRVCPKSKTKSRCSLHPISKYKEYESEVEKSVGMINDIKRAPGGQEVQCPCGSIVKRWNFAHHCSFPKHKAWIKLLPEPKDERLLRSSTLAELEEGLNEEEKVSFRERMENRSNHLHTE